MKKKLTLTSMLIMGSIMLIGNERPHDKCYWVEPGRFLASEYPIRGEKHEIQRKLRAYADAGITCFIDLTEEDESNCSGMLRPYVKYIGNKDYRSHRTCEYYRMALKDNRVPDITSLHAILDKIFSKLAEGHNVCVHCWAGVGRTGTVVGCYLVERGVAGQEALNQIAQWWKTTSIAKKYPQSPYTQEQLTFVRKYQKRS